MKLEPEWFTKSLKCGCYYCISRFSKQDIEQWVDDGQTALCPFCGIDSVIGDDGNDIDDDALKTLAKRFDFNPPINTKES